MQPGDAAPDYQEPRSNPVGHELKSRGKRLDWKGLACACTR
jgi:hypothetical protein